MWGFASAHMQSTLLTGLQGPILNKELHRTHCSPLLQLAQTVNPAFTFYYAWKPVACKQICTLDVLHIFTLFDCRHALQTTADAKCRARLSYTVSFVVKSSDALLATEVNSVRKKIVKKKRVIKFCSWHQLSRNFVSFRWSYALIYIWTK